VALKFYAGLVESVMEMQQPATAKQGEARRSRRAGGSPWPKGVSGNPFGIVAYRERAAGMLAAFIADFTIDHGREPSVAETAVLKTAAGFMARADTARNPDAATKLANSATRLRASLRKRADAPRNEPTLAEILAARRDAEAKDVPEDRMATPKGRMKTKAPTGFLMALRRYPKKPHLTSILRRATHEARYHPFVSIVRCGHLRRYV
jgi:hypothetical protein